MLDVPAIKRTWLRNAIPDPTDKTGYWGQQKSSVLSPEKNLMLALLQVGIKDLERSVKKKHKTARRHGNEARWWFGYQDGDWFYSFINVCYVLGIDADYMRKGIFKTLKLRLPRKRTS